MISCATVQEEIAWGRELAPAHQSHALECQACSRALLEFAQLDALYASAAEDPVPADFANRVMAGIAPERALGAWPERWRRVMAYGGLVAGLVFFFGASVH